MRGGLIVKEDIKQLEDSNREKSRNSLDEEHRIAHSERKRPSNRPSIAISSKD